MGKRDGTFVTDEAQRWHQVLGGYRDPKLSRSLFELAVTAVPLVLLWTAMWLSLSVGYWLCLLLALPTAAFVMRLFMIQHDCGHGAFFRHRAANDWVGRIIGAVTLTPYSFWRQTHATHHAGVGNLDHRGVGDIITATVGEYREMTQVGRLAYRLYRNPMVMFGIMPAYLFLLHYRFPAGLFREGWRPWVSTMGTNATIAATVCLLCSLVGIGPFLLVQAPIALLAASIAVWFFYVQHQFEETRWVHEKEWDFHDVALHGSSHYELPRPLAWFTGNIGVHHIHHLHSRIPSYRLRQVVSDYPALAKIGRVTLRDSIRCAGLALWDEESGRLISFRTFARTKLGAPRGWLL